MKIFFQALNFKVRKQLLALKSRKIKVRNQFLALKSKKKINVKNQQFLIFDKFFLPKFHSLFIDLKKITLGEGLKF